MAYAKGNVWAVSHSPEREVMRMEYIVAVIILLIVATGYIKSVKK